MQFDFGRPLSLLDECRPGGVHVFTFTLPAFGTRHPALIVQPVQLRRERKAQAVAGLQAGSLRDVHVAGLSRRPSHQTAERQDIAAMVFAAQQGRQRVAERPI